MKQLPFPLQLAFVLTVLFIPLLSRAQDVYHAEVKQAAINFVQSLDKMHRQAAMIAFNDTARTQWNNLPVGLRARAGISVGNMTDVQRKLFHRMLSASMSSQGYLKATSIMQLDQLLNNLYDTLYYSRQIDTGFYKMVASLKWSPRQFYLAFFGNPSDSTWGYKVEGHHLSVNFTLSDNRMSVTPMFVGTDPAEYPLGVYSGLRILGQEEDLGIKLINMLTPNLQKLATMSGSVPADIITAAESGKRLIENWGLPASKMTKDQQAILTYIIREFVFNLEHDKAIIEYNEILKAGIDKIYFGWIGSYTESKPHYYVLNGPTFLIEFDNVGFSGSANHIHTIWRKKGAEFGEDILKAHLLSRPE